MTKEEAERHMRLQLPVICKDGVGIVREVKEFTHFLGFVEKYPDKLTGYAVVETNKVVDAYLLVNLSPYVGIGEDI